MRSLVSRIKLPREGAASGRASRMTDGEHEECDARKFSAVDHHVDLPAVAGGLSQQPCFGTFVIRLHVYSCAGTLFAWTMEMQAASLKPSSNIPWLHCCDVIPYLLFLISIIDERRRNFQGHDDIPSLKLAQRLLHAVKPPRLRQSGTWILPLKNLQNRDPVSSLHSTIPSLLRLPGLSQARDMAFLALSRSRGSILNRADFLA